MATNYREASNGASPTESQQYASGISQVNKLVDELFSRGELPESFVGEPPRLHSSLEGKVRQETITIGGKTAQELLGELTRRGVNIGFYARRMVENPDFTTLPEPEQIELVRLQVRDLAILKSYPTTDEIYGRIEDLGLELLPAEVALHYRIQYMQPQGESLFMGMKPITDSYGRPSVFVLDHYDAGLELNDFWTEPDSKWDLDSKFVFSLRK